MKTFRNLMFLLVAVSLFSSCYVQDGGRRHRHHRHGYDGGPHRGY